MSQWEVCPSRRKSQFSHLVMERRVCWMNVFIGGLIVVFGAVGYHFVPKALAASTMIQHVSISGVKLMKRGEILALLALPPESSLWAIDPTELQERLEGHPRIASASVGRALLHTLAVVINERVPVATFQHAGGRLFVDRDGVVLSVASEDVISGLPYFSGLSPIRLLEGDANAQYRVRVGVEFAGLLLDRFHSPVQIRFLNSNEIVAVTDNVAYRVSQNIQKAWAQYLTLESTALANLPKGPYEIDLRYSDKVIVRQRG